MKLVPGQQASVLQQDMKNITLTKNVDVDQVISWQKGIFQFRNADLPLIARQLSRWYNIDVITDGNTSQLQLGGGISKKVPSRKYSKCLKQVVLIINGKMES